MAPDTTKIQELVDKVQDFLGGWLEQKLKAIHPEGYWQSSVLAALDERQEKIVKEDGSSCPQELDLPMQVTVFRYNWPSLLETFHLNRQLYNDAVAVKLIRNKYDHKRRNSTFDWERYHHDMETVYLFLKELKAGETLLNEVRAVMSEAVAFERNASVVPPELPTAMAVSPLSQPFRQASALKTFAASVSPSVTSQPVIAMTIAGQRQHTESQNHCEKDHAYECKYYLDMAREVFPQFFDASSLIVSSANRESSPIPGKGVWDYLVLLHCKSDYQEACTSIDAFYSCSDTTPYVQGEYLVWQFPRYEEQELVEYNVADIYPIGVLPSIFDDFISSKEGTSYCPDAKRVKHNDDATEKKALWYLGNYFPRSFAEAFCIFDFALPYVLEKMLEGRDELSICDVGAGSGGAALGLIWALRKHLVEKGNIKRLRLYGFDVNEHALKLFSEMLPIIKREWPIVFDVTLRKATFTAANIIPSEVIEGKVDFVITSKCLQEVASKISVSIEQIYSRFLEDARSVIALKGLVAIMEIARPSRSSSLNNALRGIGPELVSLIPNGEGMPIVGEERFELNSIRIGRLVGEDLLFSVVGHKEFKEVFPEWVPARKPILNEQDVDPELDESEIQREN